jgi:hypothetical protein
MKVTTSHLAGLLAAVTAAIAATASAEIAYTGLQIQRIFIQEGATSVSPAQCDTCASVGLVTAVNAPGDFTGVTIAHPGPGSPLALDYQPALVSDGTYWITAGTSFATVAAANAAFPFGTYTFTATNSSTSASQSASFNYLGNDWPTAPPALTAASFANVQGMNAGAPMMFSFNAALGDGHWPYPPPVLPDPSATLFVTEHASGQAVYASPQLADPHGIDFLLPANTLLPGTAYDFALLFTNSLYCGPGTDCGQDQPIPYFQDFTDFTYGAFTTSDVASTPRSLVNFQGGTPEDPVLLPVVGQIGQLDGTIGGLGSTDFYEFFWSGGAFQATMSVTGADPLAIYQFELLDVFGNLIDSIALDQADDFMATLGDTLARGLFEIGIVTTDAADPAYVLQFDTPVLGVSRGLPEPPTGALAGLGLALIALVTPRRRSPRATRQVHRVRGDGRDRSAAGA